ncbi:uncharacterized protein LOC118350339 isoform X3 [Canis lupus dingo]|uniref:uncharacterized protein LOC118350339 isoform X3 n=1 Tax=Canis lupus dingo TaxID=286419 RepID=UPI0020C349DF|nr:uncharacterized protein LOC118350339 isoform X3 [Canis lupus dingo]
MHRSTPMGTRKMQDLIRHAKITIKDSRAKIEQIVASCQACQLTNATSHGSNPGTQLQGDRPGAYWEVDFMEVKPGKYGYRYLLVFIDTFSGWTEAFPTKHETAQTVTKKLLEDILLGYGFPVRIGSDNGPGFISKIQLSEKLGQDSRKVGSPSHLSPPNYLENLQIFLKIYEFGLRFKERPAGTATVRRIPASISVRHPDEVIHLAFTCLMLEGVRILLLHHRQKGKLCKNFEMPPTAHNLPAPGQGQQPSIWRTCPQAPAVSFTSVHHLDPGLKIRTWIPVPFKISMNAFFLKTSKVTKSEM